jgi:hypothetical protein
LDANIIISDILSVSNPKIDKLKKDAQINKIPCYVSDSVRDEVKSKVQITTDFLGNLVRDTVYTALVDSRAKRHCSLNDPIDVYDVKALEMLFSECHKNVRRRGSLVGPLSEVEQWSIQFIADKLDSGLCITIDDFVVELTKTLLKSISAIVNVCENLVDFEKGYIKIKHVTADSEVKQFTQLAETCGIHPPDSINVACAYQYQLLKNEKVVFTTEDYGIIKWKPNLWKHKIYIEISDPLYACYHF